MTLRLFSRKFESVPASTSWYFTDLGEARGKQELFTRQSPQRLGQLQSPKGEKTSLMLQAIDRTFGPFSVAELQNACPNVSVDMIRRVLKNLRAKNQIECLRRGQNARWEKTASWQLGNAE